MASLKYKDPETGEWIKVGSGGGGGSVSAGIGIGDKATLLTPTDNLDKLKYNGWYYINASNPPLGTLPTELNPSAVCVRVWTSNGMGCMQEATDIMVHSNGCGAILRRVIYGNTVNPWEWVNPPMRLDTEYRTTERFLGKPVYVKTMDVDSLANNTIKGIRHSIADIDHPIVAYATTSDGYSIPYIDENTKDVKLNLSFTRTDVHINCVGDWTSSSCTIVVKYTKTTD